MTFAHMGKGDRMTFEGYRLKLEHFIRDGEGNNHRIEEPLVVQMLYDRTYGDRAVCLNRMLDQMRETMLNQTEVEWGEKK